MQFHDGRDLPYNLPPCFCPYPFFASTPKKDLLLQSIEVPLGVALRPLDIGH